MLAILTTHPIQYQVPIWRALASRGRVPFKVYFMSDQGVAARYDPGFGRALAWDIDLLTGYEHEFIDVAERSTQSSFWWLRLTSNFGERIRSEGATALWVQGWQVAAYWQAVLQARAKNLTIWMRGDTNLLSRRTGWLSPIKDFALDHLFRRVDHFLYVGEANRKFYLSRSISPGQLAPAPHCVENARFASDADALRSGRDLIRDQWGIPKDAICILFAGKLIREKRPLDLLAAGQLLVERFPGQPLHLLYVGTGELLKELREKSCVVSDFERGSSIFSDNEMSKDRVSISLAGFLNQRDICRAYIAANVLALPSEAETWGLVVNEAMASGLPVVVSDCVGCSEDLVRPIRPDLCFPVGDIGRFADALTTCVISPPGRDELKSLIDRYDVMRTVEAVEALYGGRGSGRN